MQVSEVTVVETLWPLPLLPVCVGGGRLFEVMVTGVLDDNGGVDRADASCCRCLCLWRQAGGGIGDGSWPMEATERAVCVCGGRLTEVTAGGDRADRGEGVRRLTATQAVQESRDGAYRSVGGDCRTRQS